MPDRMEQLHGKVVAQASGPLGVGVPRDIVGMSRDIVGMAVTVLDSSLPPLWKNAIKC